MPDFIPNDPRVDSVLKGGNPLGQQAGHSEAVLQGGNSATHPVDDRCETVLKGGEAIEL